MHAVIELYNLSLLRPVGSVLPGYHTLHTHHHF